MKKFRAPDYVVVADGIRNIVDPVMRQEVANHFARFFHTRSKSFDPQRWYELTGGKVNP